ncbi:hypothetical protein BKA80DRAFT_256193 [Phyllosticta citrichinensis]
MSADGAGWLAVLMAVCGRRGASKTFVHWMRQRVVDVSPLTPEHRQLPASRTTLPNLEDSSEDDDLRSSPVVFESDWQGASRHLHTPVPSPPFCGWSVGVEAFQTLIDVH